MALFVAARRPLGAAAVTVAGVGWPATLLGGQAIAAGAVALAAALAIPLILRATSVRTVLAGGAIGALVVVGAAWTSSATTLARDAAVDWETWDIRGQGRQASEVRFIWDSNYEGISFPSEKTIVLRVDGPSAPHYWRTTTLDVYDENHWFERLFWLEQVDHDAKTLQLPQLIPPRARNRDGWIEQRIRVDALVDDHLAAAGTPVALDGRGLGTVFLLSGGVLRVRTPVGEGESYRVWSYAPDPAPRTLARAPARYPFAASRFLEVDGREFPAFGLPGRDGLVRALFEDPSYAGFARHRPMYRVARRVAGRASSPYAAVLAIESWLRQTGGFTYDESPPRGEGAPLVSFLTQTKAGYCQHFAGAMAGMLRMLGVPARVAVGFTSGARADGTWVVTDHDAHAWVEVWFAGIGWVPFDPTPAAARSAASTRSPPARRMPSHASGAGSWGSRRRRLCRRAFPMRATCRRRPERPIRDRRRPWSGSGSSSPRSGSCFSEWGRRWSGALATCHATPAASRRRVDVSSRISCAIRASTVPQNATLVALQRAVRDELGLDGRAFAAAAARARFGPPTSPRGASPRGEVRRLIRAARRELSLWARFRGLLSRSGRSDPRMARERDVRPLPARTQPSAERTACSGDGLAREGEARGADVALDPRGARDRLLPNRALGGGRGGIPGCRRSGSVRRIRPLRARSCSRQSGTAQGSHAAHQARPRVAASNAC